MKCKNCGKEVKEKQAVCTGCGNKLDGVETSDTKTAKKKSIFKKWWFWVLIIAGVIVIGAFSGESGLDETEVKTVVEKLQAFTDMEKEGDSCTFSHEDWVINYTEVNEFVRFDYSSVSDFLTAAFGTECMSGSGIGYDFDENEVRIYVDAEVQEGNLSIISYNLESDEIVVNINGDKYEASDELAEFIEEYDMVDSIKKELEEFESVLKENDLSLEKITALKYQDIADYLD